MLEDLGLFYSSFKWEDAGGSSFVELATGINIALAGWEQFQDKLNYPRKKCEEIINSTTSSIQDSAHKNAISSVFRVVAKPVVWLNEKLWYFAFLGAIACAISGILMLWSNLYFGHDWILILPSFVHLSVTTFLLLIFRLFARWVNWCCKITNSAQVEREITKLDSDTTTKPSALEDTFTENDSEVNKERKAVTQSNGSKKPKKGAKS